MFPLPLLCIYFSYRFRSEKISVNFSALLFCEFLYYYSWPVLTRSIRSSASGSKCWGHKLFFFCPVSVQKSQGKLMIVRRITSGEGSKKKNEQNLL